MALQEITATLKKEIFRDGDFLIGLVHHSDGENKSDGVEYAILGKAEIEDIGLHKTYRFYGEWKKDKKRGSMQFAFKTFVGAQPHSRAGIINYLADAGKGYFFGSNRAASLYEKFGEDSIKIARETPEVAAAAIKGWRTEDAVNMASVLRDMAKTEHSMVETMNLLSGRGMPKSAAKKLVREFGNKAPQMVHDNPYLIMSEVKGVGFKKCDAMYLDLGHPPGRLKRQALCAWYAIASKSSGHTWFPASLAAKGIKENVAATELRIEQAIRLAIRGGLLAECFTEGPGGKISANGTRWLAEDSADAAEQSIADRIIESREQKEPTAITEWMMLEEEVTIPITHTQCSRCSRKLTAESVHLWAGLPFGPTCIGYICSPGESEVMKLTEWLDKGVTEVKTFLAPVDQITVESKSLWPSPESIDASEHQQEMYGKIHAAGEFIAALGGSPGTGKTYTAAKIISAIAAEIGLDNIAACAPTGKAANRLTEVLQSYEIDLRAKTIHSTLGVESSEDGWSFTHDRHMPLPFKFIVVDEASMIDTPLMRSLLDACGRGTYILFIGDINQLLPVGHGAPVRDMIKVGIPYGELTEIRRNSGAIVTACANMRDGQAFETFTVAEFAEDQSKNLIHLDSNNPEDQIAVMLRALKYIRDNGFDPIWDCQVLTAVNKKSELARTELNKVLQQELNVNPGVSGSPFRPSDKVVNTKNGYYELHGIADGQKLEDDVIQNADGEVYVANGELGEVIAVKEKSMVIRLLSPERLIFVPRGKGNGEEDTGCRWELGYALSVHKSQGSEWPFSISMIDEYSGADGICDRSWHYTGISRSKQATFLVGNLQTMRKRCRRSYIDNRKTLLVERVDDIHSLRLLEAI